MKTTTGLGKGLWVGVPGIIAMFGLTVANADSGLAVNIQSVQNALAQSHAAWHAKENWVSKLPKDEIVRMLGLQKGPVGTLDYESIPAKGKGSSIDWRNRNGINWLGPVMNQGNCGSCVAFSTVATLEAQTSISFGVPWLHPSFSPQALFACGGASCDTGWQPDEAANYLQSTGIPDEACMPYTSGSTGQDASCSSECSDASARTMRIAGSTTPTSYGGSVDDVKAALAQGPLVTTLFVYADFVYYSSGVYKHVTGDELGGHAVSLVGYDDAKRAWLIRNSWGPEWGEGGFAWISWDDTSGVGANTWHFNIAPPQGYVSVQAPADKEYVSDKYAMNAVSSGMSSEPLVFHVSAQSRDVATANCTREKGPGIQPIGPATDAPCSAQLDTTQLKDGRYEIYAQGATSGVRSQVREFYVINTEPTGMALSFTAAPGTDLTQPLSGRPEFLITATYGAVPIQHLEFRVIDSTGKIVSTKSNDYVLPQMRMGWRTLGIADGAYKILFHGETTYHGKVYAVDSPSMDVTVKN